MSRTRKSESEVSDGLDAEIEAAIEADAEEVAEELDAEIEAAIRGGGVAEDEAIEPDEFDATTETTS